MNSFPRLLCWIFLGVSLALLEASSRAAPDEALALVGSPLEPAEWIFQGVEHDSPSAAGVFFLRRNADRLAGEWRAAGSTAQGVAVTGEIDRDGQEITLKFAHPRGKKTAATAQLARIEENAAGWEALHFITDLGTDREYHFRPVPVARDAPLPRYRVIFQQARERAAELHLSYPQFETSGPDGEQWKTINARLAEFVQTERAAFLAAVKPLPADLAEVDPPSFAAQFAIRSRRRDTFSLELTVTSYTGGPHGRARHPGFNYHFPSRRFLALADLFAPESDWRAVLAARLNAGLVEQHVIEKGQAPVSPEAVAELQWTLDIEANLVFHLAAEELGTGIPEAVIELPNAELRETGILRPDGALAADR